MLIIAARDFFLIPIHHQKSTLVAVPGSQDDHYVEKYNGHTGNSDKLWNGLEEKRHYPTPGLREKEGLRCDLPARVQLLLFQEHHGRLQGGADVRRREGGSLLE